LKAEAAREHEATIFFGGRLVNATETYGIAELTIELEFYGAESGNKKPAKCKSMAGSNLEAKTNHFHQAI